MFSDNSEVISYFYFEDEERKPIFSYFGDFRYLEDEAKNCFRNDFFSESGAYNFVVAIDLNHGYPDVLQICRLLANQKCPIEDRAISLQCYLLVV